MTTTVSSDIGQPNRLPRGGRIDRTQPLSFQFDGATYSGFAGDTLASALLASDVTLFGRSFKYHRPRGVLSAGPEEPNALVELRSGARCEPNTRATTIELFDGLDAHSQNRWPSLRFDLGAVNSLFSPVLVAGFYYKTFMWPASFWEKVYEPSIRRAAGLGRLTMEPDPDSYEKMHAFCDVLIIGGGPAGLAAARAAGRAGARVILCDEDFQFGGRLNSDAREIDGNSGVHWTRQVIDELSSLPDVTVLRRTCVFGVYDGGTYAAIERIADQIVKPGRHQPRLRTWKIVARRSVLATGAIERPVVFGGNDRPGVMMASAVRTYVNRFGVRPGRRAAVFTTTNDGWSTAFALLAAGESVEAIIDARSVVPEFLKAEASKRGLRVLQGSQVTSTRGSKRLRSLSVFDTATAREIQLDVDTLAMSGGWTPNLSLTTHLGGRVRWDAGISAFVPGSMPREMLVVGAANGSLRLREVLHEGAKAGAQAAEASGHRAAAFDEATCDDELLGHEPLWHVVRSRGKAFIDFQHDVTHADIALAAREGFRSVEHLKRYTTLGMGTDQGKTSNINGLANLAALEGLEIAQVGTPSFRPPASPVSIGALGGAHRGKHFKPTRLTASHRWAAEHGASFTESGLWLRAQWFTTPGDATWQDSVARETLGVRTRVGICDVSTLGKIEIGGSDAGAFLDRVYINMFSTLPIGRVRYGLMLREDGFILDDGTTARLAPDRYLMTTTTAHAARVLQHLEYARQVLWPELDVQLAPVTESWSQYSIAGPMARQLLQRLPGFDLDVTNEAFPYMACAQTQWHGVTTRLFRISFSGELAYELAVPAHRGDATIRALMSAGAEWNVVPYGLEALNVLRIEKGHVIGSEINGSTTAADLGFARMMSTKKDYIGRVLAARQALTNPDRPVLVGIKQTDPARTLNAGAHLLARGVAMNLQNDEGYITSAAFSPNLNHWIGLALLRRGRERHNERMLAYDALRDNNSEVEITAPVFLDPDGHRLHA